MNEEKFSCDFLRVVLNINGEAVFRSQKEYCYCEDKYVWNKKTDKKYQKAKKEGKAKNGKFYT
jgi:hypothetical protein